EGQHDLRTIGNKPGPGYGPSAGCRHKSVPLPLLPIVACLVITSNRELQGGEGSHDLCSQYRTGICMPSFGEGLGQIACSQAPCREQTMFNHRYQKRLVCSYAFGIETAQALKQTLCSLRSGGTMPDDLCNHGVVVRSHHRP